MEGRRRQMRACGYLGRISRSSHLQEEMVRFDAQHEDSGKAQEGADGTNSSQKWMFCGETVSVFAT